MAFRLFVLEVRLLVLADKAILEFFHRFSAAGGGGSNGGAYSKCCCKKVEDGSVANLELDDEDITVEELKGVRCREERKFSS